MNCVILAAGLGTRLRGVSESKPLTSVGGVPLIEHVVRRAAAGGATNFIVVTGHEAERLEGFLAGLAERLQLPIAFARAEDWTRPNGFSVLAGSALVEGDYLLSMSDHLFDPRIVRLLVAQAGAKADVVLAVDGNVNGELIDLGDATKVEVAPDGTIVGLGNEIQRLNAIDTGLFLARPGLADAIRADIAAGGPGSLSGGVQRLAEMGRATTLDVGSARWIDVDDPQMLALAERLAASETLRDNAA
jgi:choline kinase